MKETKTTLRVKEDPLRYFIHGRHLPTAWRTTMTGVHDASKTLIGQLSQGARYSPLLCKL